MFDPERDGLSGAAVDESHEFPDLAGDFNAHESTLPTTGTPETAVATAPQTKQAQVSKPLVAPAVATTATPPAPKKPGFDKNTIALIAVLGVLYYLLTKKGKR